MWKPAPPKHREFKKTVYKQIAETSSFIYQIGDSPILRQPSAEVPEAYIRTEEFKKKLRYLKRCLKRYREITEMGVGIAAPQVGIAERFVIIYAPTIQERMLVMINPEVTRFSEKLLKYPEMCMSATPRIAPVIRPDWVEVQYVDESGHPQEWQLKADTPAGRKLNRIVQHEIDHVNGIINIDRVAAKDIIFESDPDFYTTASFTDV